MVLARLLVFCFVLFCFLKPGNSNLFRECPKAEADDKLMETNLNILVTGLDGERQPAGKKASIAFQQVSADLIALVKAEARPGAQPLPTDPLVPPGSYLTASRVRGASAPEASILLSAWLPRAAAASRSQGLAHRWPLLPGTWRTGDARRGVLPAPSTCGPRRRWPTVPRHQTARIRARESGGPSSTHGSEKSTGVRAGSILKPAMSERRPPGPTLARQGPSAESAAEPWQEGRAWLCVCPDSLTSRHGRTPRDPPGPARAQGGDAAAARPSRPIGRAPGPRLPPRWVHPWAATSR